MQRIRSEGRKAREPVLVRNHSEICAGLLSLEPAEALLPGRDAVILRAVPAHLAFFRPANNGDALSNAHFWIELHPHACICAQLRKR